MQNFLHKRARERRNLTLTTGEIGRDVLHVSQVSQPLPRGYNFVVNRDRLPVRISLYLETAGIPSCCWVHIVLVA